MTCTAMNGMKLARAVMGDASRNCDMKLTT